MDRDTTKGTLRRENQIEFCIACSSGYSAGHFGTKIMYSRTIFDGVIANSVIQNMHYEKINLLSKLISKFYIQLLSTSTA